LTVTPLSACQHTQFSLNVYLTGYGLNLSISSVDIKLNPVSKANLVLHRSRRAGPGLANTERQAFMPGAEAHERISHQSAKLFSYGSSAGQPDSR